MKNPRWHRVMGLAGLGALLALSACVDIGSEPAPSRFYVLSAAEERSNPSPDGAALLVGPVTLPRYLDRPQIVTRPSANQLSVAEYDRWGGRLDDNFVRVLAQNLGRHLATGRVALFAREQRLPDSIQVSVDVGRFEQVGERGAVELEAQWSIYPSDRKAPPTIGTSRIQMPVTGDGFAATAAAMSAAIDELAREIAGSARKIAQAKAH